MLGTIGPAELEDIALGAAVLGTGGGGDPHLGKLLARGAMERFGPVPLLDPAALADDDLVIPCGSMGAPTIKIEKLPQGREIVLAYDTLAAHLARTPPHRGRPVRAVMSFEAGGINSTHPFIVAAHRGLPLVDADGMGRAFPELQMMAPTLFGVPASPMAIADEHGNAAVLSTRTNRDAETLARAITVEMGCSAYIAMYPMTGRQVRTACIPRTISLAARIGRAIRGARARKDDVVAAVLAAAGGVRLFTGKVSDVARRVERGFARGSATLEGVSTDAGRTARVEFQNENLVLMEGDRCRCSVPDLICLLEEPGGEPVTTERVRYGFRVAAVGIPSAEVWRTPGGLALAGPRAFGYDLEYVPVERLVRSPRPARGPDATPAQGSRR